MLAAAGSGVYLRRRRNGQHHCPACRFRVVRSAEETGISAPRVEPCLGYVVDHPAGPLPFDTGMGSHPEVDAHYRPRRVELEEALAASGVKIADLRLAANSHLHFDHLRRNPKLGQLPVFVQAAELSGAREHRATPSRNSLRAAVSSK
jgi:glyoxylase-like metal-dependent hydrolase (beta-lactamase superfamily II)